MTIFHKDFLMINRKLWNCNGNASVSLGMGAAAYAMAMVTP